MQGPGAAAWQLLSTVSSGHLLEQKFQRLTCPRVHMQGGTEDPVLCQTLYLHARSLSLCLSCVCTCMCVLISSFACTDLSPRQEPHFWGCGTGSHPGVLPSTGGHNSASRTASIDLHFTFSCFCEFFSRGLLVPSNPVPVPGNPVVTGRSLSYFPERVCSESVWKCLPIMVWCFLSAIWLWWCLHCFYQILHNLLLYLSI